MVDSESATRGLRTGGNKQGQLFLIEKQEINEIRRLGDLRRKHEDSK